MLSVCILSPCRGIPLTDGQYSPCMKHLCLTLHQLPPPPGVNAGPRTLMFGDTFLDSRLHVKGLFELIIKAFLLCVSIDFKCDDRQTCCTKFQKT